MLEIPFEGEHVFSPVMIISFQKEINMKIKIETLPLKKKLKSKFKIKIDSKILPTKETRIFLFRKTLRLRSDI